jgi:hypothetical protein
MIFNPVIPLLFSSLIIQIIYIAIDKRRAAMDAALTNHRAIALSYGIFDRPISEALLKAANQIAVKIIKELWKTGFGQPGDPDYPDLYSVNIPVSFLLSFRFLFLHVAEVWRELG